MYTNIKTKARKMLAALQIGALLATLLPLTQVTNVSAFTIDNTSVAENTPTGTIVGTFSDPGATYTFDNTAG